MPKKKFTNFGFKRFFFFMKVIDSTHVELVGFFIKLKLQRHNHSINILIFDQCWRQDAQCQTPIFFHHFEFPMQCFLLNNFDNQCSITATDKQFFFKSAKEKIDCATRNLHCNIGNTKIGGSNTLDIVPLTKGNTFIEQ